jgi:hypothetical protein
LKRVKGEDLIVSPNFKTVAEAMFKDDQGRVDRGEHSQTTLANDKSIYNEQVGTSLTDRKVADRRVKQA